MDYIYSNSHEIIKAHAIYELFNSLTINEHLLYDNLYMDDVLEIIYYSEVLTPYKIYKFVILQQDIKQYKEERSKQRIIKQYFRNKHTTYSDIVKLLSLLTEDSDERTHGYINNVIHDVLYLFGNNEIEAFKEYIPLLYYNMTQIKFDVEHIENIYLPDLYEIVNHSRVITDEDIITIIDKRKLTDNEHIELINKYISNQNKQNDDKFINIIRKLYNKNKHQYKWFNDLLDKYSRTLTTDELDAINDIIEATILIHEYHH